MSNWRRHRAFIGEKVPENGPFRKSKTDPKMARFGISFRGAWGIWPRSGANHTHKPYTDELQIFSSWCMPRHDFVDAAGVSDSCFATAAEVVTPDQLRDRVGCAYLIYTAQGVRAAGLQLALLIYARIWGETPAASTRQYL